MVRKRKVSKNNSKEHKENINKDMKKRIKKRVKKNREDIGDIAQGSRVVQHSKGVVSRAPAYKAEKIRTGGFHSTFPLIQGGLDEKMFTKSLFDKAMREQRSANSFNKLFRGMEVGKYDDLDQEDQKVLSNEAIQIKRRKMMDEIDVKKSKVARMKVANDRMEKDMGLPENATDFDIADRDEQLKTEIEEQGLRREKLIGLRKSIKKHQEIENEVNIIKDRIKEENPDRIGVHAVIDTQKDEEGPNKTLFELNEEFDRSAANLKAVYNQYKVLEAQLSLLKKQQEEIDLIREEYKAFKDIDARIDQRLIHAEKEAAIQFPGSEAERIKFIGDAMYELSEKKEEALKQIPYVRTQAEKLRAKLEEHNEEIASANEIFTEALLMNPFISPEVKEKARCRALSPEEISKQVDILYMTTPSMAYNKPMHELRMKVRQFNDPRYKKAIKVVGEKIKPMLDFIENFKQHMHKIDLDNPDNEFIYPFQLAGEMPEIPTREDIEQGVVPASTEQEEYSDLEF